MQIGQIVFAVILVIVLVSVAVYFSWKQWRTLVDLRTGENIPPEDHSYLRTQAWRRLACSALMLLLAVLLAAQFVLEPATNDLLARDRARRAQGKNPEHTEKDARLINVYGAYWSVVLLALLGIITLAAFDYFAIRRYARRHYTKIREDRRAMIEEQLARLRSQRNGHG